jgi:hypothetical protein
MMFFFLRGKVLANGSMKPANLQEHLICLSILKILLKIRFCAKKVQFIRVGTFLKLGLTPPHSLTHGAGPFLRSCQLCSHSGTSQHFTEPEGSLPRSQEPSTGPYPEPDRSNPHHPILPNLGLPLRKKSLLLKHPIKLLTVLPNKRSPTPLERR